MTSTYVRTSDPSIARLLRAAGAPDIREAELVAASSVSLQNTYWDCGGRYCYTLVRLSDGAALPLPHFDPPQFGGPRLDTALPLPEGAALVEVGQGTCRGLRIFAPPSALAPLLPAPAALPWAEMVVLVATRSLIPAARLKEASYYTGITEAEYSAARVALQAKRLLNKAGAITTEGRNAAGHTDLRTMKRPEGN